MKKREDEVARLNQSLQLSHQKVSQLTTQLGDSRKSLSSFETSVKETRQKQSQEHKDETDKLKKELYAQREETLRVMSEQQKINFDLSKKVDNLEVELSHKTQLIDQLTSSRNQLYQDLQSTQIPNNLINNDESNNAEVKKQNKELQTKAVIMELEKEKAEKKLELLQKEIKSIESQQQEDQEEKERLRKRNNELSDQVDRLFQEMGSFESDQTTVTELMTVMEEQKSILVSKNEELEAEIERLMKQRGDSDSQIQQKIRHFEEELQMTKEQLQLTRNQLRNTPETQPIPESTQDTTPPVSPLVSSSSVTRLSSLVSQLTLERDKLKRQLEIEAETVKALKRDYEEETEKLAKTLETLSDQSVKDQYENRIKDLQQQLKTETEKLPELQSELRKAKEDKFVADKKLRAMKVALTQEMELNNKSKADLSALQESVSQADISRQASLVHSSSVLSLETVDILRKQIKEANEDRDRMAKENLLLLEESNQLRSDLQEQESKVADLSIKLTQRQLAEKPLIVQTAPILQSQASSEAQTKSADELLQKEKRISQLETDLLEAQRRLRDAEEDHHQRLTRRVKQMEEELLHEHDEKRERDRRIRSLEEERIDRERRSKLLEEQYLIYQNQLSSSEQEISQLRNQIRANQTTISQLNKKISANTQASSSLSTMKVQLSESNSKIKSLELLLKDRADEEEKLTSHLKNKFATVQEEARREKDKLTLDINNLKEELRGSKSEVVKLERKLVTTQKWLSAFRDSSAQVAKQNQSVLASTEKEKDQIVGILQSKMKELEHLEKVYQTSSSQVQDLQTSSNSANMRQIQQEQELRGLREMNEKMKEDLNKLDERCRKFQVEGERLATLLDEKEKTIHSLRLEQGKQREQKKHQEDADQLREERQQLSSQVARLNVKIQELTTTNETLRQCIGAKDKEIEEMKINTEKNLRSQFTTEHTEKLQGALQHVKTNTGEEIEALRSNSEQDSKIIQQLRSQNAALQRAISEKQQQQEDQRLKQLESNTRNEEVIMRRCKELEQNTKRLEEENQKLLSDVSSSRKTAEDKLQMAEEERNRKTTEMQQQLKEAQIHLQTTQEEARKYREQAEKVAKTRDETISSLYKQVRERETELESVRQSTPPQRELRPATFSPDARKDLEQELLHLKNVNQRNEERARKAEDDLQRERREREAETTRIGERRRSDDVDKERKIEEKIQEEVRRYESLNRELKNKLAIEERKQKGIPASEQERNILTEVGGSIQSLWDHKEALRKELKAVVDERERLIKQHQKEREEAQREIQLLQENSHVYGELSHWKNQMNQSSLETMRMEKEFAERDLKDARLAIELLRQSSNEKTQAVNRAENSNSQLRSQIHSLDSRCQQLESEIQRLYEALEQAYRPAEEEKAIETSVAIPSEVPAKDETEEIRNIVSTQEEIEQVQELKTQIEQLAQIALFCDPAEQQEQQQQLIEILTKMEEETLNLRAQLLLERSARVQLEQDLSVARQGREAEFGEIEKERTQLQEEQQKFLKEVSSEKEEYLSLLSHIEKNRKEAVGLEEDDEEDVVETELKSHSKLASVLERARKISQELASSNYISQYKLLNPETPLSSPQARPTEEKSE